MDEGLEIAQVARELAAIDFVVFAGAGTCSGTGIPDWKPFLRALHNKRPVSGMNPEEVEEWNYPELAQMIYNEYEQADDIHGYYAALNEELRARISPYSPVQLSIVYCTPKVITVNFDDCFDKAYETYFSREGMNKTLRVQILPDLDKKLLDDGHLLTCIHGKISTENIVFTTREYERNYNLDNHKNPRPLEEFLGHIYWTHSIVFVGVSFNDKYMVRALENIVKRGKTEESVDKPKVVAMKESERKCRHYAFLQTGVKQEQQRNERLSGIGIRPILYREHAEVVRCLDLVHKIRLMPKVVVEQ